MFRDERRPEVTLAFGEHPRPSIPSCVIETGLKFIVNSLPIRSRQGGSAPDNKKKRAAETLWLLVAYAGFRFLQTVNLLTDLRITHVFAFSLGVGLGDPSTSLETFQLNPYLRARLFFFSRLVGLFLFRGFALGRFHLSLFEFRLLLGVSFRLGRRLIFSGGLHRR